MTAVLLVRRFAVDVGRNPTTVLVLVATPVVFVVAAAGTLAEVGQTLGSAVDPTTMARLTAGWSAALVSAVAMYFQVAAARAADGRLVGAGLPRRTLVSARTVTGALAALTGSAIALVALVARDGTAVSWRTVVGTLMFAAIYLGAGAAVGALIRNPVNGTVLLLFVWILDVFFGPAMNGSTSNALRVLPTYDVSLWILDTPGSPDAAEHLVRGSAWVVAATVLSFLAVLHTTSNGRRRRVRRVTALAQLRAGLAAAWHAWRRNPVLWVLLVVVPAVFVWLADATTPHGPTAVQITENGQTFTAAFDRAEIHAGTMVPLAVASLAALAGVFIALDAGTADRRLTLAGMRPWALALTRASTAAAAATVATAAATLVAATSFDARQWGAYVAGNLGIALTYVTLGMLAGPLVGRVSGTLLAFLVPFVDLGLGQSPMLHAATPTWAQLLPGWGAARVALDGGLTPTFDESSALWVALAWLVGLAAVEVVGRALRGPGRRSRLRHDDEPAAEHPHAAGEGQRPHARRGELEHVGLAREDLDRLDPEIRRPQ